MCIRDRLDDVQKNFRLLPDLSHDPRYPRGRHSILLCEVGYGLTTADDPVGDLEPLVSRDLGRLLASSSQANRCLTLVFRVDQFGDRLLGTKLSLLDSLGKLVDFVVLVTGLGALNVANTQRLFSEILAQLSAHDSLFQKLVSTELEILHQELAVLVL